MIRRLLNLLLKLFTSLRLTMVCLALGMLVIFFGTLDQVHLGIHVAQKKYFESFFVYWSPAGADWKVPVLPGGLLLGVVLLINLLAAHLTRFRPDRRKSGIWILHSGLILMLLGMLLTSLLAVESQMRLDEGETKNFSESTLRTELAIVDTSNPDHDEVISIPEELLTREETIQHPRLPFVLKVKTYYPNSKLMMRPQGSGAEPNLATDGLGQQVMAVPLPVTYKPDEENINSAWVEISDTHGPFGTWLVSKGLGKLQDFSRDGKNYRIQLRPERFYKPYTIQLLDFTHDQYAGTDIPKNFSSRIRLKNPGFKEDREVLIYMNHPLRYGGETYYQASFANDDRTSILQVVRNPGWLVPYVSCFLIAAGLIVQFSLHLFGFLKTRRA